MSALLLDAPDETRFERLEFDRIAPPVAETVSDLALEVEPLTDEEAARIARRALAHKSVIDAVKANAAAIIAEEERALEAILAEEDLRIRDWIRAKKDDAKSRRSLFGTFTTRKNGGNLTVVDETLALASVREFCPDAIREAIDTKRLPADFTAPGFDVTPTTSKLGFAPSRAGKDPRTMTNDLSLQSLEHFRPCDLSPHRYASPAETQRLIDACREDDARGEEQVRAHEGGCVLLWTDADDAADVPFADNRFIAGFCWGVACAAMVGLVIAMWVLDPLLRQVTGGGR